MKTAYIDCIAGASGDMLLGALIDVGLSLPILETELAKLNLSDFRLQAHKVSKNGFAATKVEVQVTDHAPERRLQDIRELVEKSQVSERVKVRAMRVFTRICEVEAGIHGVSLDEVHLHEVGAVDAVVDVVGVLIGFELLGIEKVVVSPVPLGRGFISGAHGQIPLPAPATVALLKGVPIYGSPINKELVTPTGAALLVELADAWGKMPTITLNEIGYGAGTRDLGIPNVVRIFIGDCTGIASSWLTETITVLETNLDNDRGETLGHTMQRLMAEGALDVISIPAQMKKNRPAHLLKVLTKPEDADRLEAILFEETSTLGIRRTDTRRDALRREESVVETRYGRIRLKIAKLPNGTQRVSPEYDDCHQAALRHNVSLQVVTREAESMAVATCPLS